MLQIAADTGRTGDIIQAVVVGLLIVAALLAVSTVWFWRHTDPRRQRGRLRDVQPIEVRVEESTTDGVWKTEAPVSNFRADDGGLTDSDWARMTSPSSRGGRPTTPQG